MIIMMRVLQFSPSIIAAKEIEKSTLYLKKNIEAYKKELIINNISLMRVKCFFISKEFHYIQANHLSRYFIYLYLHSYGDTTWYGECTVLELLDPYFIPSDVELGSSVIKLIWIWSDVLRVSENEKIGRYA